MSYQVRLFRGGARASCPNGAEERSHGWSRDVRRQPQVAAEPVETGFQAPAPVGAGEPSPDPSLKGRGGTLLRPCRGGKGWTSLHHGFRLDLSLRELSRLHPWLQS